MAPKTGDMEVVVFHQETIKPSTPTPSYLRLFKLSLFDQVISRGLSPLLVFYAHTGGGDLADLQSKNSQHLKNSLSETLTRFYPIAGRFDADLPLVNCNDEGVPFLEAQANFSISDVLQEPNHDELRKHFIPTGFDNLTADSFPLLVVQVTFFQCGGLVICVSLSHKIADAKACSLLVNVWAKLAAGHHVEVIPHLSAAATQFPAQQPLPVDPRKLEPDSAVFSAMPPYISKRFVLNNAKINILKAKAASATVPHPTRNEALSSFLWKCSTTATKFSNLGSVEPSTCSFMVNIRGRLTSPIPDFCLGNVVVPTTFNISAATPIGLPTFVCKIREQLPEYFILLKELEANKDNTSMILELFINFMKQMDGVFKGHNDGCSCSNMCGLGLYEIDFGWGKPTWVSPILSYVTFFMDARDGDGVDAWVTLPEETMALLEQDPDFLEFVSVNPPLTT